MSNTLRPNRGRGISRRNLLKAVFAGTGATALGLTTACVAGQGNGGGGGGGNSDSAIDFTTTGEFWPEPMEWNVDDWPGQALALNVTQNATPTNIIGGNALASETFLSYNGTTPGPTIRARGTDTVFIKLRNFLGANNATIWVVPSFDPNSTPQSFPDWCLGEHVNGLHEFHTTNLHTHGLHVRPGRNPDGTFSDDILLRVIPREDYRLREESQDPLCWPLEFNENVAEANYEFRLYAERRNQQGILERIPHPPGTHWYHPHSHGGTYLQVSSGMAGLLIIEGDVDDMLRAYFADNNYQERIVVFQRITPAKDLQDVDSIGVPPYSGNQGKPHTPLINGQQGTPLLAVVSPNEVNRFRVLNGGVDGAGYLSLAMFRGEITPTQQTYNRSGNPQTINRVSLDALSVNQRVQLTAPELFKVDIPLVNYPYITPNYNNGPENFVGITPPDVPNVISVHQMAFDGVGLVNPDTGQYETREVESINLDPANRSDFLFKAPAIENTTAGYDIYTLIALGRDAHRDGGRYEDDVVLAQIVVRGDALADVDMGTIPFDETPVPPYLQPITATDVQITDGDPDFPYTGDVQNPTRTREVTYSGWGKNAVSPDTQYIMPNGESGVSEVGSPQWADTMGIDGLKFAPYNRPHRMLLGTAEEWTVNNCSMTMTTPRAPFTIAVSAIDHPFHIHTNPFWLMDKQVVDREGNIRSLAEEIGFQPRWQDVVAIPRNGGRVIYRQRFWDFAGILVNHCHILQHEDRGMMQTIEVVYEPDQASYEVKEFGTDYYAPKGFIECFSINETIGLPTDANGTPTWVVTSPPPSPDPTPTPSPTPNNTPTPTPTPTVDVTPIPPATLSPSPTPNTQD